MTQQEFEKRMRDAKEAHTLKKAEVLREIAQVESEKNEMVKDLNVLTQLVIEKKARLMELNNRIRLMNVELAEVRDRMRCEVEAAV